ncbi:hypothetical protein G7Z17_g973 [Cylindrodendrum hubeiense]|uniref:Uncharacterized protein n=1 Tax=Cylindrodendrum hubeiense TaxID=595255 RepID=A0A9P5LFS4_9HYPO|nr:hypothetical protein G7Z17_g973 [Cylindrodendrum hubeiense]
MESQSASGGIKIRLKGFAPSEKNFEFANDEGPCESCADCRPDITEMVNKSSVKYCIMCNHFARITDSSRPTDKHFRVIIFPPEASQPKFCWASVNNSNELVVRHLTIDKWKTDMKARYKQLDVDLEMYALSRDFTMKGKRFGHGIRITSWQPPLGSTGHLEGFNETILSLSGTLSSRKYGPAVVFSYNLDSNFEYKDMDDITTGDFRHVIDYFHNSDWNPAVGDVDRYPEQTLPALLIPDPNHLDREDGSISSICDVIGLHQPILRLTIPTRINVKQACWHVLCDPYNSPIRQMCPNDGSMWHTFILGPLLLGLDWIGRNAMVTDVRNTSSRKLWPEDRWKRSYARFLRQGVRIGRQKLSIDVLNISDGLIAFNAFGIEVHEMHLRAYDEFIYRNMQRDKSERNYTKAEFSEAQYVLSRDVKKAFIYLKDLFQDQRLRDQTQDYERECCFESKLHPSSWTIPSELWQSRLNNLHLEFEPGRPVEE